MSRHVRFVPRWFIVSAVLILLVPALSFLLNHSVIQGMIVQRLRTDAGLEVSSLRIRLVPRLTIEGADVLLRNETSPDAVFRARRALLTLRLLPLLRKRLAVVGLVVEEPQIIVRRDRDGRWHSPFGRGPRTTQEGRKGGFTVKWLLPDVQVAGGAILLVDEYERETPRAVRLTNVQGVLDAELLRTEADLILTADIGEGAVALSGSLSLVDAAPSARFEGALRLERFDPAPWIDLSPESPPRRIDGAAQVLVVAGDRGYEAVFSRVHAGLEWVTIRGQVAIQGAHAEAPRYTATLSATPVSVATVFQELPPAWIPQAARHAVAQHELSGTLELLSATLGGRTDQPGAGTWKGTAKLSRGAGEIGAGRTPIRNLSGTLFFDPFHVEAMDLSGDVGALRVSNGKLGLTHLTVAPALDLQLTGTGKTRDLLALLHGFGGAAIGEQALSAITDPRGDVQLSVHVAGPLTPAPHVDLVKAEITGHDLGARIPEWDLAAEHLDGTVAVTPRLIELKHLRGHLGPIRFDVQGAMEMGPAARFEDVTVELSASAAEVQRWLDPKPDGTAGVTMDGSAQATVHLSGPLSLLRWTGRVDLTQAHLTVPPIIRKPAGTTALLEGEGTWVKGKRLTASRLALVLPEARVEGRVNVRLRGRPWVDWHVRAGPLPIEKLSGVIVLWPGAEGIVQASLAAKGRGADWRSWSPSGWIEVQRGKLLVPGLRDPLRDLALRLQLTRQDVLLNRLSFKAGDSDVTVSGVVKQWTGRPAPTLMVTSSRLDVTRLIPRHGGAEGDSDFLKRMRRWAASSRADVTVTIQQAQYHRLAFKTLSGHLRLDGGQVELDGLRGETPDGLLSARITADLRPRDRIELDGDLKVDGMPVHQLLSLFDPDADRLRGLLSMTGRLQAAIHPATALVSTLQSRTPLQVRLTNGRMLRGTVLPKVLKILNVPALLQGQVDLDHEGIPFDVVSATVTVRNGVLASQDIVFDSPLMKISGAGTLDLPADELDLALAVSPFGAYSDLIGKIPLFGRLLAGDRPGLTTALFEVKGPQRNPDVRYLPIESIAKGLTGYPRLAIDLLTNVLTLPQKTFAPDGP